MNIFFSTAISFSYLNIWLLLLRIFAGSFMLSHGWPKLLRVLDGNFQFADPLGLGATPTLMLAVFSEFFCSILLILGFVTRLASLPLVFTMMVAAFIVHWEDPFGTKEFALLYLLIFITIFVIGPGKYSIDNYLGRQS
jgi:putative oxidoreductase